MSVFKWLITNPWFSAALAYTLGIACGIKVFFAFPQFLVWVVLALIIAGVLCIKAIKSIKSIVILVVIVTISGLLNSTIQTLSIQNSAIGNYVSNRSIQIYGTLVTRPRQNDYSTSFMLAVKQIEGQPFDWGNLWVRVRSNGNDSNNLLSDLDIGQNIFFNGTIQAAKPSINYFGFNSRQYLYSKDCGFETFLISPKFIIDTKSDIGFGGFINRLSGSLIRVIENNLDPLHSQLMISLIYGDRTVSVSDDLVKAFRFAGLTHLLVVSGAQVGLLAIIVFTLLRPLGYPGITGWRGILVALFMVTILLVFGTITGFDLSIKRSILMAALWLIAKLVNRRITPLTALAQSALIITIPNPLAVLSASYQLSFMATFAVLYGFNVLNRYERNTKRDIVPQTLVSKILFFSVLSSLSVSFLLSPILAFCFGQIPIYSPISNIIAVPLSGVILIWGVITNASFVFFGPIASIPFKWVMNLLLDLLMVITNGISQLPFASGNIEPPSLICIVLYYIGIFIVFELICTKPILNSFYRNLYLLITLCAFAIALTIYFISYGQTKLIIPYLRSGDAIILRHNQRLFAIVSCSKGKVFENSVRTIEATAHYLGFNKFTQIVALEPKGINTNKSLEGLTTMYIKISEEMDKNSKIQELAGIFVKFNKLSNKNWSGNIADKISIDHENQGEFIVKYEGRKLKIHVRKRNPIDNEISLFHTGAIQFTINSGGTITKSYNSMQK